MFSYYSWTINITIYTIVIIIIIIIKHFQSIT
ncbi:unnamed protein product [Schistosoma mattheei]|uniref:Uncharacterized protein n=1 Tax=Schistosoma mattheei TaxID=31246 RepID=A0A3P8GV14_9TREM|nr:unnamed protein product [Schistosoma mattheei]